MSDKQDIMSGRINLALQFWEGDKQRAMHLARFIADLEPVKNENVDFTFFARFDTGHDDETFNYVAKKFANTYRATSRKSMTGWPAGCNSMALDLFAQSTEKTRRGEWKGQKALYLIEADVIPLCRDWLSKISAEWGLAQSKGKFILGAWCPFHSEVGHINGNMLVAPDIKDRIQGLDNCPPKSGWDAHFGPKFEQHWMKSRIMSNHYDHRSNVSSEILWSKVDGVSEPVVVHGVKDFSAEAQVRERLGIT